MICMYEIQARCFREYERRTLARVRRRCSRVGRLFCETRLKLERHLTARRQEVEEGAQYEMRRG